MRPGAGVRTASKAMRLAVLVVLGLIVAGPGLAEPSATTTWVIEGLDNIRNLTRPRQDGYTAIWDGDKFVQCHAHSDQSLSCEAAGATMQPSLARVLTPDRKQRLTSLGWRLDPSFGAYTKTFAPTVSLDQVADRILTVLSQAYDADLTRLYVQTRWVAHQTCPPRHGPGQNRAGMIDDDPMMAQTAVHGCAYSAPANVAANGSGGINLLAGSQAASASSAYYASPPAAPDLVATDVVADDPAPVREPRARRARRPRTSSGHRASTGKRRSRSGGGHSSHHK